MRTPVVIGTSASRARNQPAPAGRIARNATLGLEFPRQALELRFGELAPHELIVLLR